MNTKYMVIVAAMAVMLVGATALATDDAFATKKKYNQATSKQTLGKWFLARKTFVNIGSQVQGDENAVAWRPNYPILPYLFAFSQ
jgi:hypothetical protein